VIKKSDEGLGADCHASTSVVRAFRARKSNCLSSANVSQYDRVLSRNSACGR